MSTYCPQNKPFVIDTLEGPSYLKEYLNYLLVTCNFSKATVKSYYIQARLFLRFLKCKNEGISITKKHVMEQSIADLPFSILDCEQEDITQFLAFSATVLDNCASSRGLKLTVLKTLFHYFLVIDKRLDIDPTLAIPQPKQSKPIPKYLSLEECKRLLNAVDGSSSIVERDYCMVTLLLNCGLRISELTALNLKDITDDSLRIRGKGSKERMVYLNEASRAALKDYLKARSDYNKASRTNALFINTKNGNRITTRRVEQIVEQAYTDSGLSGKGYTVHDLRHTAATLLYQNGADILELQAILGHESIKTTQIYTHMHDSQTKEVIRHSPLAGIKRNSVTINQMSV